MRKISQLGGAVAPGLASAACLLMLPGLGLAATDGSAARVTVAVGDAESAGSPLDPRGSLAEGADLDTGDEGGCSLLLDEDALMELCAGTNLRLARKGGDPNGPRVVELDRGEVRMVVEPRLGAERIEVHTPAAIATILGTILHVSVDALGVTTVTSSAARVMVESATAGVSGATTISAGERVVVEPGQSPSPARRLDPEELAALGGCLIDFHEATLAYDRRNRADAALDNAINEAIADVGRVDVALGLDPGLQPQRPIDDLANLIERPGPAEPFRPPAEDQVSTGAADEAIAEILSNNGGVLPPCCQPPSSGFGGGGLEPGEIPGAGGIPGAGQVP